MTLSIFEKKQTNGYITEMLIEERKEERDRDRNREKKYLFR